MLRLKLLLFCLLSMPSFTALCQIIKIKADSLKDNPVPSINPTPVAVTKDDWTEATAISITGVKKGEKDQYKLSVAINAQEVDIPQKHNNSETTANFLVASKVTYPTSFPTTILLDIKKDEAIVGKVTIVANKPSERRTNETRVTHASLRDWVKNNKPKGSHYDKQKNLLLEGNTIHIFIDKRGNFLYSGLPTTATQENTFQFHIVTLDTNATFSLRADGVYRPSKLSVFDTGEGETVSEADTREPPKEPVVYDFGIEGPFTDEAKFKITDDASPDKPILDAKITVAKLYHVSIATGFLGTTLRNPSDITKMAIPDGLAGDSTLVANDPATRGLISIAAIFYPTGRSFLLPPSGGLFSRERFGIVVGAQLNDKLQENLLTGLAFDFARGGSITFGAHFGRRNYVAGYDSFDFGEDKFSGTPIVKKEWQIGLFFGVIVDTRVALKLFNIGEQ